MPTKGRLGKFGTIFLALALCLALTGAAFAKWSQDLTIVEEVSTGELDWEFTNCSLYDELAPPPYQPGVSAMCDYTTGDGFAGGYWRSDKNVGWGAWNITDPHTVEVTLYNVYPCYFNAVAVYPHNCGTVPLVFEKVIINGVEYYTNGFHAVLDLDGNGTNDFEIKWGDHLGYQFDPCYEGEISFWIHVLQDDDPAFQGSKFTFTIELVGIQWNKYD